jgi:membrane protein DedA with SNARE-associated domain
MSLPPFIENLPPELTLLGILAFTLIYSFSMPITEEIALVLVGILAHARGFPFPLVFLFSYPASSGLIWCTTGSRANSVFASFRRNSCAA